MFHRPLFSQLYHQNQFFDYVGVRGKKYHYFGKGKCIDFKHSREAALFSNGVMLHGKQLETSLWLINYLVVYSGLVNVSYKTDLSFFLQS